MNLQRISTPGWAAPGRAAVIGVLLMLLSLTGWAQVSYSVKLLPTGKYQVCLRADASFGTQNRIAPTAQITLRVPSGTTPFSISNVQTSDYSANGITPTNAPLWNVTDVYRNPTNATAPNAFDYFVIAFPQNRAGTIPFAGTNEVPLFTFDNTGGCTGGMEVWRADDPFFFDPPNQPFNVGNEMTVQGFGANNTWVNNYAPGSANCITVAILTPTTNSTVSAPTPTISGTATPGSTVTLTASNGGSTIVPTNPTTGIWSTTAITFVPGTHSVTATAGFPSGPSNPTSTTFVVSDQGAFACNSGSITANFIANGTGGQSGTMTLTITTTTPGSITLAASAAGISSNPTVMATTLVAGQNTITVPLTYDGTGAGGVRTVNVTSSMGTGDCSTTVLVGARPTIGIDTPANNGTATTTPTIAGTATPGSTVVVTQGPSTTLCTTTASIAGTWSCNISLPTGSQTLTAQSSTTNGTSDPATTSFTVVTPPPAVTCIVQYRLVLGSDNVYRVMMMPNVSYTSPANRVTTAQVTLIAPANSLTISSLTTTTGTWVIDELRQPGQNAGSDYFLIALDSPTTAINFVAGQEVELFSFRNNAPCTGAVQLYVNGTDPVRFGVGGQTANPSQEMAIVGYQSGSVNGWCGNLGGATTPIVVAAPSIQSSTATVCSTGGSVTLTASGAPAGSVYMWSGPGLAQTTGASVVATPGIEGTASYSVVAVINSCTSVAASTNVLSTSAACPPTIGAFACVSGGISANFIANGTAGQNGTMTLTITTTTPGPVTLTAAGTGISSNPALMETTLVAGQNSISIPLAYDGSGAGGVRTVNVTSTMSSGVCSATVMVGSRPTIAINTPSNTTATTTPTITGTATPGSTVVVTQGPSTTLCTTTASNAGTWSCNVNLPTGSVTLTAQATDPNGTSDPTDTSFTVVAPPAATTCIVQYRLVLGSDNVYRVMMTPNVSYTSPANRVTTAQVTLIAPANSLTISSLTTTTGTWVIDELRQPGQNAGSDYFLIALDSPTTAINFVAGQEVELFSFRNNAPCTGAVQLYVNGTDPVRFGVGGQTANPSQEMAIVGYQSGSVNGWCGNLGGATAPIVVAAPSIQSSTATVCSTGGSVTLTASGAPAGSVYMWSGPGLAQTTGASVVATPGIEGTASYSVVAVINSCTSVAASTNVLSTSAACPPTIGAFACVNGGISANFVANGTGGQNGMMTLTITTTTPGPVTLTAAGTGISSNPALMATTLVAGQNSISIPLVYNGTGAAGTRTVNVTSTMSSGVCSATVAVSQPQSPTSVTSSGPCTAFDCGTFVRYGLKLGADGITYTVYMKSAQGFTGAAAQIGTGQVTIKLPAGTQVSSVSSLQTNTSWGSTTPVLNYQGQGSDYRSYGLSQTTPFAIPAETEIPLFSFRRLNATCLGEIALWSTTDTYGFPNTLGTTPGNQITIAGYGTNLPGNQAGADPRNAWRCNYTCPVACPAANPTLVKLSPGSATQNVAFSYTMVVTNPGSGPTNGAMTVTDVLPTGMNFVSGGGNGWSCIANGQNVLCSTNNAILGNSNSSFVITVNPTLAGTFPNSATLTGGGSSTAIISAPCLVCPPSPTIINVLPAQTDLAISIQMPAALAAGTANTINVTLTNLTGVATGPQTVSLTMPAGLNAPASFVLNGGWNCNTTTGQNGNQVVVCSNPANLSAGQTMTLPISVTPSNTLINNFVILIAQTPQAGGEINLTNNVAITGATQVQGADLALTFGTLPLMPPGANAIVQINITNVGQANIGSSLTVNVTLPVGVAVNSAFLTNGWTLLGSAPGANGTTIATLFNANAAGLAPLGLTMLNLPISVGANTTGVLSFQATVVPVPSEFIVANNTNSASTNGGRPDLIVTVTGPNPAFIVGQTSNVLVTVTNIGSVAATGPFTTTITMPVGYVVNTTNLPAGWLFVTSGNTSNGAPFIVLQNTSTTLASQQSLSISLPFTPSNVNANITGTIVANVNVVQDEVIVANNVGFLFATPISSGIVVVVGVPTQFTAGVTSNVTVLFTNVGTASYTGPLTTQVTLNSVLVIGAMPQGWVLNNTVINPNGTTTYTISYVGNITLLSNGSTTLIFPVTPGITSGGQSTTITVVTPINPLVISAGSTTIIQVVPIMVAPTSNVVVIINQTTNIIQVGSTTIFNVIFTNNGNGGVSGPITTTFTVPAGMTVVNGQLPQGWVIANTVTINNTTVYTITNNNVVILANGGTLSINIPVFVFQPITLVVNPSVTIYVQVNNTTIINQFTYNIINVVAPNIQLFVSQPAPVLVVNQTSIMSVSIVNAGTGPAYGPLTVNVTLPAGVQLVNSQMVLPAGWLLISNVNNVLTFQTNNVGGFAVNQLVLLNLPITATTIVANTTINVTVTVLQVLGQTTSVTQVVIINVPALNRPDLIIQAAQPSPVLTVNQSSNIAVTITNIGSVAANGPIYYQMTVPAGLAISTTALSGGWSVSTITANFDGSATYMFVNSSLNIAVGQSINTSVVVVPALSLANATMNIGLFVMGVTNEINIANNGFTLVINTPVQASAAPDQAVVIQNQSFSLAVGQASVLSFNVNNIGTAGTSGALSLTFTMPVGFTTTQSSFITGNWNCNTFNNQVVCTNVVGLTVNAASALTIPVMPLAAAGGMINPVFQIQVAQNAGEVVLINNFGTIQYIGVVATPDLAVSFPAQSFTLTAGQATNVLVQVSNLSSLVNAAGPLSLTFAMPQGFVFGQNAFTTGGWNCTTSANIAGCTYAGGLNAGASLTLSVPVIATGSGVGVISFVATVGAVQGEQNLANNTAQLIYSGAILSSGVVVSVKAILQGPYNESTGLMNDDLRVANLIPATQPYATLTGSSATWVFINSGNETVSPAVLATTGNNAIVDWVMVEIRSAANPAQIVGSKPALIQRDGDVVSSTDGVSSLTFTGLNAGTYYVVLRHRNHLGVMSRTAVNLSPTLTTVDFTDAANAYVKPMANVATAPVYSSTNTNTNIANPAMLWSGDTDGNGMVVFQGFPNDLVWIFNQVMFDPANTSSLSNFIAPGYELTDINMDGNSIFQGPNNEVNTIFFNVLGHPDNGNRFSNFIILQHLP